jgi:hypothetical protein
LAEAAVAEYKVRELLTTQIPAAQEVDKDLIQQELLVVQGQVQLVKVMLAALVLLEVVEVAEVGLERQEVLTDLVQLVDLAING